MAKAKTKAVKILREYLKDLETVCHVDKAIMFGSYAAGMAGRHSDIDIAIFSRNVDKKNRLAILSKAIMLIDRFKTDIQPIIFSYNDYLSNDNDFIVEQIKKKGIEIKIVSK